MSDSELDPHTASVSFSYEPFGDPEGEHCVGRVYYWFDPACSGSAVDAHDFRKRHPEIDDHEWARFFYEAFDRGETAFEQSLGKREPHPSVTESGGEPRSIGRLFGPRPPKSRQ